MLQLLNLLAQFEELENLISQAELACTRRGAHDFIWRPQAAGEREFFSIRMRHFSDSVQLDVESPAFRGVHN